jgi:hypothetical protein
MGNLFSVDEGRCLGSQPLLTKVYKKDTEVIKTAMDMDRQWMTWPCRMPGCNTLHVRVNTGKRYTGGALLTSDVHVIQINEQTIPQILHCIQHSRPKLPGHILETHMWLHLLVGIYDITDVRHLPDGFLIGRWRWIQGLCKKGMDAPVDGIELPGGHVFLFNACNKVNEDQREAWIRLTQLQRPVSPS